MIQKVFTFINFHVHVSTCKQNNLMHFKTLRINANENTLKARCNAFQCRL